MIVEFSVTNFGSIRDTQTLSMLAGKETENEDYFVVKTGGLRLLKLAMIYGANASGKTMVLKAMDTLRNLLTMPKNQKTDVLAIFPFQFDGETRKSPTVFRLIFIHKEVRYDYTLEVQNEFVLMEKMFFYPNGKKSELFSRETDPEKQVSTLKTGSTIGLNTKNLTILEGNVLWNNTVPGAFLKSNVEWPEMLEVQEWLQKFWQPTIFPNTKLTDFADHVLENQPELKGLLLDFLSKADFQISDARIETETKQINNAQLSIFGKNGEKIGGSSVNSSKFTSKRLFFTHTISKASGETTSFDLPWEFESHGTLQYYGLSALLAVMIKSPKITLFDELESSLHAELMKHFILTFLANAQQSQLIFTTHNLQLLDDRENLRKDTVWFTQKRADGSTELYSLADFDSQVLRKNSSVMNAYKTGKIGAIPHPGSIFLTQNQ